MMLNKHTYLLSNVGELLIVMGAVFCRQGSWKLFKSEHPERLLPDKFLARLIPHKTNLYYG